MKPFSTYIFISLLSLISFSQAPSIEWQNTITGDEYDELFIIQQSVDGGYIFGGWSDSNLSGDKTEGCKGNWDYWVVKTDSVGNIQWQNTIGGNNYDWMQDIAKVNDGGYLIGGTSDSNISDDKTENSRGESDYWIIKIDTSGNIAWQKTIGGNDDDWLYSIQQTYDNGFILGGLSQSNISGEKSENCKGYLDYWVVKTDSIGNIQWQKTIGGSQMDRLYHIRQATDGGYILAGSSSSEISGDKTDNSYGLDDYWIIKLDTTGNITWQKTIGGDQADIPYSIEELNDKGFIIGGHSGSSISGDKTEECIGGYDYWLVKIDSNGNTVWQNTIGGSDFDFLYSTTICQENGFLLSGTSYSTTSGDKSEICRGSNDYWVVKTDSLGAIMWEKTLGGSGSEVMSSGSATDDGGFILSGWSASSIEWDKSEANYGYCDYWIIKLNYCNTIYYFDLDADGYGDMFNDSIACNLPGGYVLDSTDCDDTNSLIHPSTQDLCNGLDDNCNHIIDEDAEFSVYYADMDGDNFGNSEIDTFLCSVVGGYVIDSSDCNDAYASIYPGAPEIWNGIDDNCNQIIDDGLSVINAESNSWLSINPNPANDIIMLTIYTNSGFLEQHSDFIIDIFDIFGNKVLQINESGKSVFYYIDISKLPEGFYILQLSNDAINESIQFLNQ